MFVEVEHTDYQAAEQIGPVGSRERLLERLAIAALITLQAVSPATCEALLERAKGWE
jgi:hypothetical protein